MQGTYRPQSGALIATVCNGPGAPRGALLKNHRKPKKYMNATFAISFSKLSPIDQKKVVSAASRYIDLQSGKARVEGTFDSVRRFHLSTYCECCDGIRSPSRAFPYSHLRHAKSIEHVCSEAGIAEYTSMARSVVRVFQVSDGSADVVMHKIFATVARNAMDKVLKNMKGARRGSAIDSF
ncbi:MAG: hypothetical protein JWR21_4352 [Herminiimonas sp.]|nr:hypothetical protein [Herminiimonas sp.]